MKILIINGPNLNMLGRREPGIYGSQSWDDYYPILKSSLPAGVETEYFQSNHEGDIIDKIQQTDADGIALNAGAYTHTSLAIADAISAVKNLWSRCISPTWRRARRRYATGRSSGRSAKAA